MQARATRFEPTTLTGRGFNAFVGPRLRRRAFASGGKDSACAPIRDELLQVHRRRQGRWFEAIPMDLLGSADGSCRLQGSPRGYSDGRMEVGLATGSAEFSWRAPGKKSKAE